MSAQTNPISSSQFNLAIQDLPLENIYAKAHEIQNSIEHLQRSNAQLKEFSDSIRNDSSLGGEVREEVGDKECLEAIQENDIVIERQRERVGLLRGEVERRGRVWHGVAGEGVNRDGDVNGGPGGSDRDEGDGAAAAVSRPRLTDEELQRRLMERMGDDDDEDGEGGLHL